MMAASPSYFQLLLVLGIISLSDLVLALCANLSSTSVAEYYPESTRPATVIAQFVAGHNAARQEVGVPPLEWDSRLATFARVYAQQRRHDCMLVHSPGYVFGENIFWGQGRRWTATDVMASWVVEKQWYHYDTNSCAGPDCTHYTQIVWRTTKRVGCAKIVCDTGDSFAVCEYYPPGNYIGARPYKKP